MVASCSDPTPTLPPSGEEKLLSETQFQARNASGDVESRLPLHAERLQGHGIVRAADQRIRACAAAERSIGLPADIIAGEIAEADLRRRRENGPHQRGRFGEADIDPEATLKEINERFAAVPFDGAYWIALKGN